MMAAAQGKRADDTLASIYQHSSDAQVKRVILQSYLITGDSSKLLEVARQETNPELVKTAIQTLGAMSAAQDLLTMYRATNNAQTKADIINSLIASGHNGRRSTYGDCAVGTGCGTAAEGDSQSGDCGRNVGRARPGLDISEEYGCGD